jgi:hypothetical protein
LNDGFVKYQTDAWVLHELNQTLVNDLEVLGVLLQEVYPEIVRIADNTTDAINMVNDVIGYITDVTSYFSRLHCQTQLPRLLTEYNRKHKSSMDVLVDFDLVLQSFADDVKTKLSQYVNESITLTEISGQIKVKQFSQRLQEDKLVIDTVLNSRFVVLNAIQDEINQIFYIALTQVNKSFIAENSVFWKHFKITDPKLQKPTTKAIDDVDLPLSDFGMIPEGELFEFWKKFRSSTEAMFPKLQRQKDVLDAAIARAKLYFDAYLAGNEIGETFSK